MSLAQMDRFDVMAELKKRFGTVAAFERARSLPEKSVNDVLRGKPRTGVSEAIEEALAMPLPLKPVSEFSDDSSAAVPAHRLNERSR